MTQRTEEGILTAPKSPEVGRISEKGKEGANSKQMGGIPKRDVKQHRKLGIFVVVFNSERLQSLRLTEFTMYKTGLCKKMIFRSKVVKF